MKNTLWYVAGFLLLTVGLIWIVYVTGAVFSRSEGFTSLTGLWVAFAFHAVCMGLGTALVGKAVAARRAG